MPGESHSVTLNINGRDYRVAVDSNWTLNDLLRNRRAAGAFRAVIQERVWTDLRIVLGGVETFPYRCGEAEDLLRGLPMSEDLAVAAADAALECAKPLRMNQYKVVLSKTLVRRSLLALAGS